MQNRLPESALSGQSLAAMPPQVLVYTLDASDDRTLNERASAKIAALASPLVESAVAANGGHMVEDDELAACPACVAFFNWGGLAALEIGLQREQIRNYGAHSVTEWGYGSNLPTLRAAIKAKLVLFVVLKQTRQTTGRKVAEFFGGQYTIGKQIDVACLADLSDGRMTWCTSLKDDSHDVGAPGRTAAVVQSLLRRAFPVPAAP